MSEVAEIPTAEVATIVGALRLIDEGLGGLSERQLVSASEVTDLLLDVRSALSEVSTISGDSAITEVSS